MVTVITGASRGIGAAIAQHCAMNSGAQLVLTYRTREKEMGHVVAKCQSLGAEVFATQLDLRNREDVERFIPEVLNHFNRVDHLINNAGFTDDSLALRLNRSRWDAVIDVNLSAPFSITRAALKPMIKQRYGRIINLSSVIASRGRGGQVNYAASKGGIESMTRALAVEVASRGITVNAVSPGWISTEMTQDLMVQGAGGLESTIPVGRVGTPDEVAQLITFLLSDSASYITGQVIHIDGGLSIKL